jgi:hypothetical protein
MDKEISYATYGCPKQFHIIQTIHNKPKFKGQRLSFQGPHNWLCSENDRARREDNKDREHDESLASTSIALTPSLCKGPSVENPAEHLQGGLKVHIMVQVPPSEKKKRYGVDEVQSLFSTLTKKSHQFYRFNLQGGTSQKSVFWWISHEEKWLKRYAKTEYKSIRISQCTS